MNEAHRDALIEWLSRPNGVLHRRTPPKRLSDETARTAEIAAMVRTLAAVIPDAMPTDRLAGCLAAVEHAVERRPVPTWPSAGELVAALEPLMPRPVAARLGDWRPDTDAIDAGRIARGEPVAETSLFGAAAARIQRHGVTGDQIAAYQRTAWVARREAQGRAPADAWLAAMQGRS